VPVAKTAVTTVSARKLIDILRSLPDGADVSIKVENKRATIQAGRSRFALQTLDAAEFPTVAVTDRFVASFELPQRKLKHLIRMVHFAMAQQDIRYYLNGLLLVTDGSLVKVVATDGHRLSYCEASIEGADLARAEVIIPRKTVLELQRLLADGDEPVAIDVSGNQVRLRFGEVEMVSKIVEGKFPDYQRVIPQGYTKHVVLSREALAASLARASILTTDKFKGVRLSLSPGTLQIQTSNAGAGGGGRGARDRIRGRRARDRLQRQLPARRAGQSRLRFRADAVRRLGTSALLTVPGDEQFRYVVMPMRI